MTSVWNSNLPRQIKLGFFYATVESVLLYGSEFWTLNTTLEKSLDGGYTRMLPAVLNISKSTHVTSKILVSFSLHRELPASKLELWDIGQEDVPH